VVFNHTQETAMRCQLCTSDRTTAIATGKPWQRLHCLSCGGQHFQ
jgi:hypothetical protein